MVGNAWGTIPGIATNFRWYSNCFPTDTNPMPLPPNIARRRPVYPSQSVYSWRSNTQLGVASHLDSRHLPPWRSAPPTSATSYRTEVLPYLRCMNFLLFGAVFLLALIFFLYTRARALSSLTLLCHYPLQGCHSSIHVLIWANISLTWADNPSTLSPIFVLASWASLNWLSILDSSVLYHSPISINFSSTRWPCFPSSPPYPSLTALIPNW